MLVLVLGSQLRSTSPPLFLLPLLISLTMLISNNRLLPRELELCCLLVMNMIGSLVQRHIAIRTQGVYHSHLGDLFFTFHRDHHLVTTYKMNRLPAPALGSQVSLHLSDLLQLFSSLRPSFVS